MLSADCWSRVVEKVILGRFGMLVGSANVVCIRIADGYEFVQKWGCGRVLCTGVGAVGETSGEMICCVGMQAMVAVGEY